MGTKIFINLPTKDLNRTARFYARLGFSFDPQFSDDNGKCMIISDDIFVMFLSEQFFRSFTRKDIPESAAGAIYSLQKDTREEVDDFMQKCIAEGATDLTQPQTMDFMYTRSFEDPDGHIWEVFYMDLEKFKTQQQTQTVSHDV